MYQIGFGEPPRWGRMAGGGLGPRAQAGTCLYVGEFAGGLGPLPARVRPWVLSTSRRVRLFRRMYGPGSFLGAR
jgi:hypothetical protein